jgi:CDP-diacylglycerol--glycerol-3-phosphate 3-phosphatidyltransferase
MTPANKLTLLRLALVPMFLAIMEFGHFYARVMALIVFVGASLTDLYDGRLARRTGTITRIGTYLDPLADKLLIAAALISFLEWRELRLPAWMVVMIIAREFLITGLRSLAAARGILMASETAGKLKTGFQMTAIITILVILIVDAAIDRWPRLLFVFPKTVQNALATFTTYGPYILVLLAMIVTVVSGIIYIRKYQKMLEEEFAMHKTAPPL